MKARAHPVAVGCLVLVGLIVIAGAVLAAMGKAVPTYLPELAFSLVAGGLGVTVPMPMSGPGPGGSV